MEIVGRLEGEERWRWRLGVRRAFRAGGAVAIGLRLQEALNIFRPSLFKFDRSGLREIWFQIAVTHNLVHKLQLPVGVGTWCYSVISPLVKECINSNGFVGPNGENKIEFGQNTIFYFLFFLL